MKLIYSLLAISSMLVPSLLVAQEVEAIPEDFVRRLAPKLVEEAGKLDQPKIKIEADVEKANGVHLPGKLGALIVPQKELKESEELAAKFKSELGAPLAYLFVRELVPIVDGKKLDAAKMRTVSITDNDGKEHIVHVLSLAVKQLSEDDYRLHAYGIDGKPLVDVKFAEGTSSGPAPVAVELKNPNEAKREGSVVVTVFGKYQATFQAGFTGE